MSGEIIFLAHRIPFPPDRGDRIRSYHMLRHIAARRPVHLLGFVDSEEDMEALGPLAVEVASLHVTVRGRRIVAGLRGLINHLPISLMAFASDALAIEVKRLMRERPIDAFFVYSGQMAQYVPLKRGDRRFVMDFVDVDSEKYAAYGARTGGPMGWVHRREAKLLGAFERKTAARADVSLFVSEAEAEMFRKLSGLGPERVRAVDNGIDTVRFDPVLFPRKDDPSPLIVFTGQMDYRPNIDAVEHFARRTFKAIRAKHPNASFAIVGRSPTPAVRALGETKNVIVTGEVPDVRPWLAAATVVVAPLEIARGVQNKVLEAMAMARPVVASAAAFEGIDATPGEHLIIAERLDMANAVSHLISHPDEAAALGQAARARMIERYGWDAQLSALDDLLGLRSPIAKLIA
jgi:sugar transferase (PEP-CTERM/EpsH1 system associated)